MAVRATALGRGHGPHLPGFGWVGIALGVGLATALGVYAARRLTRRRFEAAGARPGERSVPVTHSLTVNRSPQECYALWHDVEKLPRFMQHLDSVRSTGEGRSHWVARLPTGKTIEWDSEIVSDVPGELIAWRSLPGSEVEASGWVRFEPAPAGRSTIVRVRMRYRPPGGLVGTAAATLTGQSPEHLVREDLRRFRQMLETGEIPTTHGQPHGRRSLLARTLPEGRLS